MDIDALLDNIEMGLSNCPSSEDIDACDEYFRKMRAVHAMLTQKLGEMEAEFATSSYTQIKNMSDADFKRIGKSSTLVNSYIEGMLPKLHARRIRAKELKYLIRQSSDELRSLISFRREEMSVTFRTNKQK